MWQVIVPLVGGLFFGALAYFFHKAQSNAVTVDEQSAALRVEAQRREQLEAAQLAAEAQRLKDIRAKVIAAGPDDLAAQLRDVTRPRRP